MYMESLKVLTYDVHRQLALFCTTVLTRPLRYENGQMLFEHSAVMTLWYQIATCLTNEADALLYEQCLKRIHSLACEDDDGEENYFPLWLFFWNQVTRKMPMMAAVYIEEFLNDMIDRKQIAMVTVLSVSSPFIIALQ